MFCSSECYWNYKKEYEPKGEEHPSYKRIMSNCTNCGCEISLIPCEYSRTNKNGDNHNFCSQECYWEFRKKYYVGENNPLFGKEKTEEQRQQLSVIATLKYTNGVFNRQTKPQKIVNSILDKLNINYINEYNCKYYSIDNYLNEVNLMIEVMGDYFHAHPITTTNINEMQLKNITKDKKKNTYIKKYYNIDVLYLWESDINNNLDLIENLVLLYTSNKGKLKDYNSYNYKINNDKIQILDDCIIPFYYYKINDLVKIFIPSDKYKKDKEKRRLERKEKVYKKVNCKFCNSEIEVRKSATKNNKTYFCNKECRKKYNESKKIHTNCNYCGKDIFIYKYKEQKNKNNFCSKECYKSFIINNK
jgi:G:T-mismatch repair DNA endonuclease (very short patch repair protein)